MDIIVSEESRYRISADRYSISLTKAYFSKKDEAWKYSANHATYHGSLGEALRKLARLETQEALDASGDYVSVGEVMEKLAAVEASIQRLIDVMPKDVSGRNLMLDATNS